MTSYKLYTKIESLPPKIKEEALDFIDFLVQKAKATQEKNKPVFGSMKGKIQLSEDFDAPMEIA